MISYQNTAKEIREKKPTIAILPIGSTEQHGAHLPTSTDTVISTKIAEEVAKRMDAYLLPTLPFSTCREHDGKMGSFSLKSQTLYHVIEDIFEAAKRQGIKTLIIMLGHGGIFISNPVVRELNANNPDMQVVKVDLVQFFTSNELNDILECKNNLHACEYETSLMYEFDGEHVHPEEIVDCVPDVPRDYLNYAPIFRYSPSGVWGMPSLASKEKGEKIFEVMVQKSIDYINDVLKINKERDFYHE